MVTITIDRSLKASVPSLILGLIEVPALAMPASNDALWKDMQRIESELQLTQKALRSINGCVDNHEMRISSIEGARP